MATGGCTLAASPVLSTSRVLIFFSLIPAVLRFLILICRRLFLLLARIAPEWVAVLALFIGSTVVRMIAFSAHVIAHAILHLCRTERVKVFE